MKPKIAGTVKPQINYLSAIGMDLSRLKTVEDMYLFAERATSLRNQMGNKFPDLKAIFPNEIKKLSDADKILGKFASVLQNKLKVDISYEKLKQVFKEVWNYISKMLIGLNVGIALFQFPAFTIPIALICTISVILNAHKHGITFKQAWTNFKRSFKEFISKSGLSKNEKAASFIPLFILNFLIFINQYVSNILSSLGTSIITIINWPGADFPFWSSTIEGIGTFISANAAGMLSAVVVQLVAVFFVAALIYLLVNVIEDWVLRKGEKRGVV